MTRTKALGRERIARKLSDSVPCGENPLRAAVWEFMRPMLSPNLAQLNRDAFVIDQALESTVRLEEHRADSGLDELDLGDEDAGTALGDGEPGWPSVPLVWGDGRPGQPGGDRSAVPLQFAEVSPDEEHDSTNTPFLP